MVQPNRPSKSTIKITVDPDLLAEARAALLRSGTSLSAHISRLLREHLDGIQSVAGRARQS